MDIMQFIIKEGIIMIPTLFVIAEIIKPMDLLDKKYIPLLLLIISITLSPMIMGGYNANNIVQSILITGATVLTHEIVDVRKEN